MRYTFTQLYPSNELGHYWTARRADSDHVGGGKTKIAAIRDLEDVIKVADTFDNDPLVMLAAVKTFVALSPTRPNGS